MTPGNAGGAEHREQRRRQRLGPRSGRTTWTSSWSHFQEEADSAQDPLAYGTQCAWAQARGDQVRAAALEFLSSSQVLPTLSQQSHPLAFRDLRL